MFTRYKSSRGFVSVVIDEREDAELQEDQRIKQKKSDYRKILKDYVMSSQTYQVATPDLIDAYHEPNDESISTLGRLMA